MGVSDRYHEPRKSTRSALHSLVSITSSWLGNRGVHAPKLQGESRLDPAQQGRFDVGTDRWWENHRLMEFGALVPHFGVHANRDALLDSARLLDRLGFDSLWVRDHMLWSPHKIEDDSWDFLEPFITLAGIASITEGIKLGTAVLIPVRHPLKLAQDLASLSWISQGRVIAGIGLGSNPKELGAAGIRLQDREEVFVETLEICRQVWAADNVSWEGKRFHLEDATIRPKPFKPIPVWYGGSSRAAVRRAMVHCDGWIPGRMPLNTLDDRLSYLRELKVSHSKSVSLAYMAFVCIDEDRQIARRCVDIQALASSWPGHKTWLKPLPSNPYDTDDVLGLAITGNPDDIVQGIRKLDARGVEHFVFDLRFQFGSFDERIQLIADEVLPKFR